ncbi:hypothetical protein Golomagni_07066 [Golovinomyces magnicellulatus]|nr:hypothetical protein Golomagni_07066 [Golovinomyces magnicellulatus]
MATTNQITRITLFKIPNAEDQNKLLDIYKQMPQKAVKDGKPYILNVKAGSAKPDQRAQGFTIGVVSTFASQDDMVYYDEQCAAHAELKAFAKSVHQGVMMMFFEDVMA